LERAAGVEVEMGRESIVCEGKVMSGGRVPPSLMENEDGVGVVSRTGGSVVTGETLFAIGGSSYGMS